jgi:hypothetical protein
MLVFDVEERRVRHRTARCDAEIAVSRDDIGVLR